MDNDIPIDITPDKSLIQKLGLVGYRTEQAIAELLDNSIDARIGGTEERIEVHIDFKGKKIHVKDNGHGMDKDDLTDAMTIARGTKTDERLGRFGIGMKSACSALGKKFTIVTSKTDSNKEYCAEYDEQKWLSDDSQTWRNFHIGEKRLSEKTDWHGTQITISKLNIPLYPNQVSNFKESFGIRYFPYLQANQVSIKINTIYCKPTKPDIVEGSWTKITVPLQSGKTVYGYVALLKKRSIKGHYGIHLFRNGRLVKAYEKFGFTAHPENAKIIGELNLDHVPVNFHKSEFIEESLEYREAVESFSTSENFRYILHSSKSTNKTTASIASVFDYFNKNTPAQHLEKSVRSNIAKELLDNTEPFEIRIGEKLIKICIKSLQNNNLYAIKEEDTYTDITINKDDNTFGFVKNPLFLIGMIASEVKLLADNPDLQKLIEKRNSNFKEFLDTWIQKTKNTDFREKNADIPPNRYYNLDDELIAMHELLGEKFQFKFQFTALSTLTPYFHNIREKIVYTIHTTPGNGEYLAELLSEEFGSNFTIVDKPDPNLLNMLLKMPTVNRILAVREYHVIKGTTVAYPEKAFVDLLVEKYTYGIPLDETELGRMFHAMKRQNLIDMGKLQRYGKYVKKTAQMTKLLEI